MKKTDQRKNDNGSVGDRNKFLDKAFIQKVIYALLFGGFLGGSSFSVSKFLHTGFSEQEKISLFAKIDAIKVKQDAILLGVQKTAQDLNYHKEGDHMTFEKMTEKFVQLTQYENEFLMLKNKINHLAFTLNNPQGLISRLG